jgi:predicted TIM-barrel fold metal-dependent hydrolase
MKRSNAVFNRNISMIIYSFLVIIQSCGHNVKNKPSYCGKEDFSKMEKIDIHCHISVDRPSFMEQAVVDNFRILTINTDAFLHPNIEEQQEFALKQIKAFPGQLAYLTTFSMKGWDDPNWQQKSIASLEESFKKGAIGVKIWKNIGMVEKDKEGKFIMIDNPKFDSIFNYLEKLNIPVCGHLGEPKNCWLPIEEMTVNNDKKYFKEHPEYHMYLHPDCPSYDAEINARDNMLRKHSHLHFMGAHLGSLEWSVDELAKHFDMLPNMNVDMAARICHLEKQAENNWQKVHDFFIKYQDRIIYGTDQGDFEGSESDSSRLKEQVHKVWTEDWKFFTSDSIMSSWAVNGNFRGLHLPKDIIEKIYYKNAIKMFPGI